MYKNKAFVRNLGPISFICCWPQCWVSHRTTDGINSLKIMSKEAQYFAELNFLTFCLFCQILIISGNFLAAKSYVMSKWKLGPLWVIFDDKILWIYNLFNLEGSFNQILLEFFTKSNICFQFGPELSAIEVKMIIKWYLFTQQLFLLLSQS